MNYNNYIKENKHSDIDPYNEEEWDNKQDLVKISLIDKIKKIVEKYGGNITTGDLQAESSPMYNEDGQGIHLVEAFRMTNVEVVIYGGYKFEDVIDEYNVPYENLGNGILREIEWLLVGAIKDGILEEDI